MNQAATQTASLSARSTTPPRQSAWWLGLLLAGGIAAVSLVLAQVSENKQINSVYQDLFDPEGAEIYLKPISEYVFPNAPVNFYTLLEAARRKGETAIGYRIQAHARNSAKNYGVSINPPKHREITFAMEDRLIVLANS